MPTKKQPASKNTPKTEKIPRHFEPYQDKNKVFWSFSIYDSGINFPKPNTYRLEFSILANHLKHCETRTWLDIEKNRHRDHPIEVDKIEKFARDRLRFIGQDDIDELWSIHIDGLLRLWGIRDQSLFKILWIDQQHEICPSNLRNT